MEFIDYYKILELDKNATQEDIKKAYRRLARKHHPDLNPNDKDAHKKFQQINEANEVLSDPEKRKKYDQYGKDWQHAEHFEKAGGARSHGGGAAGSHGGFGGTHNTGAENEFGGQFSDFFESLFGHSGAGSQARFRGQDYHTELRLQLQEVYHTHQQVFTINGNNIRITVPAGVENGQSIKLKGHGGKGVNGGPAGDLYITFIIADHPVFKRSGNDLHASLKLPLYTAILGGEVTLDTFSGKIKLKVSPETQNGTKVRLKEKGFPVYKKEGEFGDLYISWSIEIPTHLTTRQKELFAELSRL
ncbi:MAG: J domain-containing protein [Chitinophagaceae bacterium]|nr:J domain-containing protein [Chitinophagaceae bacterium]